MSAPAHPFYIDGDFSTATRISRTPYEYPFRQNGDLSHKTYDAIYVVSIDSYSPTAIGTVDPELAGHYLLAESRPEIMQGKLCTFRRTYGNIPAEQEVPTSIVLALPALGDTFPLAYGAFRVSQPDSTVPRFNVYRMQSVTSDSGAPGFYPTGGTYTLTFAGDTTGALNYNDSAGTVQTALNALTSISNRGGVVVTGSYNSAGGLVITFNDYAQITIATGSLTGGTVSSAVAKTNNGYSQSAQAGLIGTPSAITSNVASLTANGGTITFEGDYSDSTHLPVTGMRRCYIQPVGGYYRLTGGTYTLTINGVTTGAINYNADGVDIQAALDLVAPGLYRVAPWPTPASYAAGYVDSGSSSAIFFAIYFLGGAATGGTFTLTVGADTTAAIAYNASAATVETALELLASVTARGGCSVSGTLVDGYTITFSNAALTASSASLTPVGALVTPSLTDTGIGRLHKLTFTNNSVTRDLYVAGHGIAEGEAIYIKLASGATYYSEITNYSIPDANTIRLNLSPSDAYASVTTIAECGRRTRLGYTVGAATVPARRVTSYYLPGVTSGITTADDIPIPVNQSDGPNLIEAIFAGTGTINWQVGELTQYLNSSILSLTTLVFDSADL